MSTLVSYKGEPLTTVNNETKTLTTAGKYLEANIILTDTTVSENWNWMGRNPTKIYESTATTYFRDSVWVDWTPTTTATALTTASEKTSISIDTEQYEYLVHFQMRETLVYEDGTPATTRLEKANTEQWFNVVRYSSNYANLSQQNRNYNYAYSLITQAVMDYLTSKSAHTIAYSWGYGLYPSATAPTFSNSTTTAPNLSVKIPVLNARCNATYLAVERAEAVDLDASFYTMKHEVYRIDIGTSPLRNVQDERMYVFNNTL